MPSKRDDFDPVLVEFRVRFSERVKHWYLSRKPPMVQRQFAALIGLHHATVNGYLNHPESMAASFIEKISAKIPEFETEWISYRRLEEATSDSAAAAVTAIRSSVARRAAIRQAADSLKDSIDALLKLMDQLADEPSSAPAKAGRSRPARRRKG